LPHRMHSSHELAKLKFRNGGSIYKLSCDNLTILILAEPHYHKWDRGILS
jgi:hypothetical protein